MVDDYSWAEGPGKFEGNTFPRVAAWTYEQSLDWTDEQIGTTEELGWFGLLHFGLTDWADLVELGWEPDIDAAPESRPVAAIVGEDCQGFVTVTFYDSEDAAQADWSLVEGDYDHFYDTRGESDA